MLSRCAEDSLTELGNVYFRMILLTVTQGSQSTTFVSMLLEFLLFLNDMGPRETTQ